MAFRKIPSVAAIPFGGSPEWTGRWPRKAVQAIGEFALASMVGPCISAAHFPRFLTMIQLLLKAGLAQQVTTTVNRDSATRRARRSDVQSDVGELFSNLGAFVAETTLREANNLSRGADSWRAWEASPSQAPIRFSSA